MKRKQRKPRTSVLAFDAADVFFAGTADVMSAAKTVDNAVTFVIEKCNKRTSIVPRIMTGFGEHLYDAWGTFTT